MAHGPPPKPPIPATTPQEDRIARRQRQAELIKQGQELRASERSKDSGGVKKRFWKDVKVHETPEGLQIHLDHRPIRTPSRNILTLPHLKPHLANAIALEWDLLTSASQALMQHLIPLTSLVSRAAEIQDKDSKGDSRTRDEIVAVAMHYLDTDTLLCWAPATSNSQAGSQLRFVEDDTASRSAESLRDMQIRIARPITDFLTTHVWPGIELVPITDENSILPRPQLETTKEVIRGWISGLPAFELVGLERGVLAGKSLLVAVRLLVEWSTEFRHVRLQQRQQQQQQREEGEAEVPRRFGIEEAARAADLEVSWQTGTWGEVEDTHDVNKEDLRRQLGSVVLLVSGEE
ncbi:MAG: ATP synthase complex assembly protein atp12 [Geoglossum umbratile]|nr:MAG: ATP synthase complex assembly protein atp12 [Geoglossum umbratile]